MNNVDAAFQKYAALIQLERATGTKTTRARNDLLRALPDLELIELAVKLNGAGLTNGIHNTSSSR